MLVSIPSGGPHPLVVADILNKMPWDHRLSKKMGGARFRV